MTTKQRKQLRIDVAKDVIAQVNNGIYRPQWGSGYLPGWYDSVKFSNTNEIAQAARERLCTACALGCAFLSYVKFRKPIEVWAAEQLGREKQPSNPPATTLINGMLSEIFTFLDIRLIEILYEGWETQLVRLNDARLKDVGLRALHNRLQRLERDERLIHLMQNIIDNGGVFMPQLL